MTMPAFYSPAMHCSGIEQVSELPVMYTCRGSTYHEPCCAVSTERIDQVAVVLPRAMKRVHDTRTDRDDIESNLREGAQTSANNGVQWIGDLPGRPRTLS